MASYLDKSVQVNNKLAEKAFAHKKGFNMRNQLEWFRNSWIGAVATLTLLLQGCTDSTSSTSSVGYQEQDQIHALSVYVERNDGDLIAGIRDALIAVGPSKEYRLSLDSDGNPVVIALYHVAFNESELEQISNFKSLRSLCLGDAGVNDNGLVHLANLTDLESLWLSGNNITDEGVSNLGGLKDLTQLSLAQTSITDASVELLASMSQLRDLRIWHTKITPAGVERIRKALPYCWIQDEL